MNFPTISKDRVQAMLDELWPHSEMPVKKAEALVDRLSRARLTPDALQAILTEHSLRDKFTNTSPQTDKLLDRVAAVVAAAQGTPRPAEEADPVELGKTLRQMAENVDRATAAVLAGFEGDNATTIYGVLKKGAECTPFGEQMLQHALNVIGGVASGRDLRPEELATTIFGKWHTRVSKTLAYTDSTGARRYKSVDRREWLSNGEEQPELVELGKSSLTAELVSRVQPARVLALRGLKVLGVAV